MDKIDRNVRFKEGEAINNELIRRLLDKSDELVEGYNKTKKNMKIMRDVIKAIE